MGVRGKATLVLNIAKVDMTIGGFHSAKICVIRRLEIPEKAHKKKPDRVIGLFVAGAGFAPGEAMVPEGAARRSTSDLRVTTPMVPKNPHLGASPWIVI